MAPDPDARRIPIRPANLPATDHDAPTVAHTESESHLTPRGLRVRCPHCQEYVSVAADTRWSNLICDVCGSHFSVVDDSQSTRDAAKLATVGHFELVDQLGVGAFGVVWKARDRTLDRTVALKMPRRGSLTPEETEAFLREARAAAQLQHPNIVRVYEVGRDGESVFIVSEIVRGQTLSNWLLNHRPAPRQSAEISAKIADALQHAHDMGVVHRDLKPGNIMLDFENQPHVMDFGLAKREAGEVTVTADGRIVGTPAYMSPEQARGDTRRIDRRSDVYSMGVVLFQLLTGELPFRGNASTLPAQIIGDEPPSPRRLCARIPRDIETICLKCLEKAPDRRYATAGQLRDDLGRFIRGEPIVARPVGKVARWWRWCQRNALVATLAATVAVLMVAAAGVSTYAAVESYARAEKERELREDADAQRRKVTTALGDALYSQGRAALLAQNIDPNWRKAALDAIKGAAQIRPDSEVRTLAANVVTVSGIDSFHSSPLAPMHAKRAGHVGPFPLDVRGDGHEFAIADEERLYFCDWNENRSHYQAPPRSGGEIVLVRYSADGTRLAVLSAANELEIWDVSTRRLASNCEAPSNLSAIEPGPGRDLVTVADWRNVFVIHAPTGKIVAKDRINPRTEAPPAPAPAPEAPAESKPAHSPKGTPRSPDPDASAKLPTPAKLASVRQVQQAVDNFDGESHLVSLAVGEATNRIVVAVGGDPLVTYRLEGDHLIRGKTLGFLPICDTRIALSRDERYLLVATSSGEILPEQAAVPLEAMEAPAEEAPPAPAPLNDDEDDNKALQRLRTPNPRLFAAGRAFAKDLSALLSMRVGLTPTLAMVPAVQPYARPNDSVSVEPLQSSAASDGFGGFSSLEISPADARAQPARGAAAATIFDLEKERFVQRLPLGLDKIRGLNSRYGDRAMIADRTGRAVLLHIGHGEMLAQEPLWLASEMLLGVSIADDARTAISLDLGPAAVRWNIGHADIATPATAQGDERGCAVYDPADDRIGVARANFRVEHARPSEPKDWLMRPVSLDAVDAALLHESPFGGSHESMLRATLSMAVLDRSGDVHAVYPLCEGAADYPLLLSRPDDRRRSLVIAVSPDSQWMALGGGFPDGSARDPSAAFVEITKRDGLQFARQRLIRLPPGNVLDVAFSPDGTKLAAATDTGDVYIWRDGNWSQQVRAATRSPGDISFAVRQLAFHPQGHTIAASCGDGVVRFLNASDGSLTGELAIEGGPTAVAYHPAGESIAVATHHFGLSSSIGLWNVNAAHSPSAKETSIVRWGCTGQSLILNLWWNCEGTALISADKTGGATTWNIRRLREQLAELSLDW